MADFVYVDNSNVFIEGQRISAVSKGLAKNIYDAMDAGIIDQSYRLDFGKLYKFVLGNNPPEHCRAVMYGSRPPQSDSVWQMARNAGFEVVVEDRNAANKEKKIDTGIVTTMLVDAYTKINKQNDVMTLVAGDGDYVPPVKHLTEQGYRVNVVYWGHASRELQSVCSRFINLDKQLTSISL